METHAESFTWPVIGHDWAVDLLRRSIAAGRPPHALLIAGPSNIGKSTLARAMAQELQCTAEQRPCGTCRVCQLVANDHHPDVRWIKPQGRSLKIDQVRALTRQLALSPLEGPWQIAILERFELATAQAADALLKTLEEPTPSVILVLLTHHPDSPPPTITSRCQIVALRPIPRKIIERALIERWQVSPERAGFLSHICSGRLGWAVGAAATPELMDRRNQTFDDLINLLHSRRVTRFAYAKSLARQNRESVLNHLDLWASWWRDILLLASQSPVPLTNIDRQNELAHVAGFCDTMQAHSVLSALQTSVDQLSRNANPRLALEVLLLDLPTLPKA